MNINDMPLPALIKAARERAKRERRDYSQTVADMLDRLCDEVERRETGERRWIKVRCDTAAAMRKGQAI